MRLQHFALIGLLTLPACGMLDACTFEDRFVRATGSFVENGSELVHADVSVAASRGSINEKSFDRTIVAPTLVGHVSSITLARADQPGSSLLAIPLGPSTLSPLSSGTLFQREGETAPDLGGLYEVISANLGILDLTTDVPSHSHVLIPLSVTEKRDWYRPHCS